MADSTDSKPPFWSSLPGIFTGLGGVLVALTGLITALYSTGVIGSNATANANTAAAKNRSTALVSASNAAPALSDENDRYKQLAGKWQVIEEPSQHVLDIQEATWEYEAAVSGNLVTFNGKMTAVDGNKNLDDWVQTYRSTFEPTLIGLSGVGEYKVKPDEGAPSTTYPAATIQFNDKLTEFHSTVAPKGQPSFTLSGKKL